MRHRRPTEARRHEAGHGGKAIEELIFWAEHDGRTHDDRIGMENSHRLLAESLGIRIGGGTRGIGSNRRDLYQGSYARPCRRLGDGLGAQIVNCVEFLCARLIQYADKIDRRFRIS